MKKAKEGQLSNEDGPEDSPLSTVNCQLSTVHWLVSTLIVDDLIVKNRPPEQ